MRFIYADPSLVDNVGHPNTTCRLVTRGLRQRGIEPEIYAYKDVIPALRAEIGAKPHFHAHAFYGPDQDPIYGWLKTFHSVSEATLYDLSQLPALEPGDLVYFNSAQPPQLMALVLWLTTLPPERAPQVVVEFATEPGLDISIMPDGRYACTTRDPRQDARAPFYRFAGSKISPHVEKHLHMMTFEPQSSAIYSSLIQHPVGRLPLPQNAIAPLRRRPGRAPLTVAVLGHQRVDKGYLLVPEIARLLLAKRSQIRLLIHNGAPTQMPEAQRVVRSLAASEPRIIVDERTAGPPIWAELLNASDLIVCPYPADRFRVAPSFVAVEGIANAIPVVGPALTSIDRLIQEWGGCGTVFGEHEPNSIVAATVTVIDDFARYAALAYAAAERWPQRNGPDRLVDAILACAAQPAHAVAPLTTTMQAKPEGSRNGGHHPIFEKFELPPTSPGEFAPVYLRQLLGTDAPLILEIGANDGADTTRFLKELPNATIYAFEPDPRALMKFKARGFDPRVHLFEIAIGAKDGEAEFYESTGLAAEMPQHMQRYYSRGWDQSGSLRAPKNHITVWPWIKFKTKIKVAVKRLDTWASECGITAVDFIWADMQGAEGDLIAGGRETLAKTRYLYTEYSNDELYEGQPTLAQLASMLPNFSIIRRYQNDVLLENMALRSSTNRSSTSHVVRDSPTR